MCSMISLIYLSIKFVNQLVPKYINKGNGSRIKTHSTTGTWQWKSPCFCPRGLERESCERLVTRYNFLPSHSAVRGASLSQVPPKIIFPAFQLFELEVTFLSSTENMPYYDEGESNSSVSTTPEEIKFAEWLILGANLPELNLESADSTSKCSQVTAILSRMQTRPWAFQLNVFLGTSIDLSVSVFSVLTP